MEVMHFSGGWKSCLSLLAISKTDFNVYWRPTEINWKTLISFGSDAAYERERYMKAPTSLNIRKTENSRWHENLISLWSQSDSSTLVGRKSYKILIFYAFKLIPLLYAKVHLPYTKQKVMKPRCHLSKSWSVQLIMHVY